MKGVIDAVKDIYEGLHENQETKSALVELKTQIATEIVDEVEKQSPELFLSVGKDLIVDYLVADGLFDKIKDTMMGMTVMKISAFSEKFRYLREKIGKVSTQEELEGLKDQIIKDLHAEGSPTASQGSHRSSQEAKNENMDSPSSVFSHEGEHLDAQAQEKSLHLMRQYEQLK